MSATVPPVAVEGRAEVARTEENPAEALSAPTVPCAAGPL
jgi:hypothetical protein